MWLRKGLQKDHGVFFIMPLSELEGLRQISDFQRRRFIREQLDLKHKIEEELKQEDLPVLRETSLKEALEMIANNIQKVRMEGIL